MARIKVRFSVSTLLVVVLIIAVSFNLGLRARQAKLDVVEQELAQTQAELDTVKSSLDQARIAEQVLQAQVTAIQAEEQLRLARAALAEEQRVLDATNEHAGRKRQTIDGFIWSCIRALFQKKTKTPVPESNRRVKEPPVLFDRESPPNTAGFAAFGGRSVSGGTVAVGGLRRAAAVAG